MPVPFFHVPFFQVVVPPSAASTPTYDGNGNLTSNGAGQAYTWDARNQLMSIVYTSGTYSGTHTEFTYDGLGRRVKIVERSGTIVGSGTITNTKQFVWVPGRMAEERDASGTNVTKRFFAQGEQVAGANYYYTRDHLGSVREMVNNSGTIVARYDYDPFGRKTYVQGTMSSDFQYAGMYLHATSVLNLTFFRAYDANSAKWLSRDPSGERGGINLYAYVANNTVNLTDILGLCGCPTSGSSLASALAQGVATGFLSAAAVAAVAVAASAVVGVAAVSVGLGAFGLPPIWRTGGLGWLWVS